MPRTLLSLRIVAWEAFVLMRRDRIFLPALIAALLVSGLANLASDWSVEDFTKILFDIGFAGLQLTGSLVAAFWGIAAVTDSRQEGALEVQLAAPISRTVWLLGKYLGLVLCLLLLAGLLLALWQGLMLLNGFGVMTRAQCMIFAFMVLGWLVLGALAMLLACCMRQAVALFALISLWLVGLTSSLVAHTLGSATPPLTQRFVKGLARVWDLQQFNLVEHALTPAWQPIPELAWRGAYGGLLIAALLTLACWIFNRRDITA